MTNYTIFSRTLSTLLLSVVHTALWIKSTAIVIYYWLALSVVSPFKHKGVKTDLILKDSKKLKKLPLHLAIAVSEKEISYSDLSLLVCWAYNFGIQWVSLYDMKGVIRRDLEQLKSIINNQYSKFEGLQDQKLQISVLDEHSSAEASTGTSNSLIVMSSDDSHSRMINLSSRLCSDTVSGAVQSSHISWSSICLELSSHGAIPEPNLAIVCGSAHCLMGYPPWWTRLTEIVWLSTHHKVTYQQFFSLLLRYSNCQQRYGK